MADPRLKTSLPYSIFGLDFQFDIPHDVFSTFRIDEGTSLLLENLATLEPRNILDLGCGYGALGLPIAAKYKNAKIQMVDRDLIAAAWSKRNAEKNGLTNVSAYGSLGYRNLQDQNEKFDWILCNVPARIGRPFIAHLICEGMNKLTEAGDLRIVVINDLNETIESLDQEYGFQSKKIIQGPRHSVFAYQKLNAIPHLEFTEDDLYFRDRVRFSGNEYARPFDLGGDDPKRLQSGLPLLLDVLPRSKRDKEIKVLCIRSLYGILPFECAQRFLKASITSIERDLLASTYIARNLESIEIDIREVPEVREGLSASEKFELIVGEVSPGSGEEVCFQEIEALRSHLDKNGELILLCFEKTYKTWIKAFSEKTKIPHSLIVSRDGYVAVRLTN